MSFFKYLRNGFGFWRSLDYTLNPDGKMRQRIWIAFKDAVAIAAILLALLALYGYFQEKDIAESADSKVKAAQKGERQAMSLLETCLKGLPLLLKNDIDGVVEAAIFCSPSKEVKL